MESHLNNTHRWGLAAASTVVSLMVPLYFARSDLSNHSLNLLLGLLPAYLLLLNYFAVELVCFIRARSFRFVKVAGVVLSSLFLLTLSWLLLGRHFYASAVHGYMAVDQGMVDFFLRTALKAQLAVFVFVSMLLIKKSDVMDLIFSIMVSAAILIFVVG